MEKQRRVMLKLSGEALAGEKKTGFDEEVVKDVARQVKLSVDQGVQVAIVIGGGNFWRGRSSNAIDRPKADQIGMLATVMNCIYAVSYTHLNHLMLVNLINKGVTGKQAEKMLDAANITCNKNTVPNDPQSAFTTSGIRLGTAAVTTRGFNTADMDVVAQAISLVTVSYTHLDVYKRQAWKVVKFVKSNGIAVAKDLQTVGIGPGQVNRVWAIEQCFEHANELIGPDATKGAVLASDAYFPFADNVEAAHKAGITAIIQPGGSIRDKDCIDKCNEYGIAMVFTGMRHFKH